MKQPFHSAKYQNNTHPTDSIQKELQLTWHTALHNQLMINYQNLARDIEPRDLSPADITGISVGIVSSLLTLGGLGISFCAWKYPSSPAGKLGKAIHHRLLLRGGDASGGDAHGDETARGGAARGGDVGGVSRALASDNSSNSSNRGSGQKGLQPSMAQGTFAGGNATGGGATGREATGGDAQGGSVSF